MELEKEIGAEDDRLEEQVQLFHVLAVDDSVTDRKILEKLLSVSSYQVTCVESGNKALEYLGLIDDEEEKNTNSICASCKSQELVQGSKVNLIITDYSMPGMNGYDLLRKVKDSSWRDIPVVVMSSENVPARINMCLEGGAEEFLLKPVQLSDMKKIHFHISKPSTKQNLELSIKEEQQQEEDPDKNQNKLVVNKRKSALLSDCSERSRPKMEELAVL